MSEDITIIDGVAFVLPRYEGGARIAKRVGRFGIGMNWRWTSFNIGIDILEAGALLAIGPFYFWIAHIDRQRAAFERLDRIAQEPPSTPPEAMR